MLHPFRPLTTGLLMATVLLLSPAVRANVGISPMVIETELRRGQAQGTITIRNTGENDFRARVYTSPFTYDPETGIQFLESSPQDLTPYLQFSPRELQVPGTNERRIRFIARIPPSAPDGEYRAMIFTENLQATVQEEGDGDVRITTTIVPRIGVAVYVRKGDISHQLSAPQARYNPETQQLQLLVENTGLASVRVEGNWQLRKDGETLYAGAGPAHTVIAENSRYLTVDYRQTDDPENPLTLTPGTYELSGHLGSGVNFDSDRTPFRVTFTIP
ncbi:hypothetical protein PN441_07680 [Spirulina major CS-329]|uniref:hypothetical protein n=1 Tax=Spirulina TaxID=1154 RepID=UPI00232C3080|nr:MULTISPECIES: hypothetical protein [Spirulina]MDB9495043.1 hypothetical protein [Spirulina subsalsa CS-330]MDB9502949.1 hypothetical protein [Spirulina major CS-329]